MALVGEASTPVAGLAYDSRQVGPGGAFFCVKGFVQDGHSFIADALARGARTIVVEGRAGLEAANRLATGAANRLATGAATVVAVPAMRPAMGLAAANFFDHPSTKLRVLGVTGTNGKTTTTHLIRELLVGQGHPCGLIGTVQAIVGGETHPAGRTTPEAFDLQDLAARMVAAGDTYLSMEVGSHALALDRVSGFEFDIGVFTNLTQDHLDFHGTMEEYFQAKASLFKGVGRSYRGEPKSGAKAVVLNADDAHSLSLAAVARVPVVTYALDAPEAGLRATDLKFSQGRATFTLTVKDGLGADLPGPARFRVPATVSMTGRHNVANALAAVAVVLAEGLPAEAVVAGLAGVKGAAGRFETVDAGQGFLAVVDYAHTPDGLENVLQAVRSLHPRRVITVFGCGGDRDRSKRPLMGEVVARLSDLCVVTSDNPRSERPEAIIEEIRPGLERLGRREGTGYLVDPDRARAIGLAVDAAGAGDVVLVAGKGHETYQTFADRTISFNDREVLREAIQRRLAASHRSERGAGRCGKVRPSDRGPEL
jgi:UDP-N-acetylmuramoyl-L-alanyl-D-glutamate--2,6-diaminopimelate ligase